ncbi:hypothetical protein U1Q18_040845 [Sarracenia purpurea var. burkii]
MREEDIRPDVISYTSIIGRLGLIGEPDKARDVLKGMKECGCYPDVVAYNAAIRNLCITKRLRNAYSLLREMLGKGLSPNAVTYNMVEKGHKLSNVSFRRIKVPMELAYKEEALQNLSKKMTSVDSSVQFSRNEDGPIDISNSDLVPC